MAHAIYWDTSALLKLYAPEPDSSAYLRLLIQQPADLAISFLHGVELYYALRGKESRGEIAAGSAKRLFPGYGSITPMPAFRGRVAHPRIGGNNALDFRCSQRAQMQAIERPKHGGRRRA